MHHIQTQLLCLAKEQELGKLSLRQIAKLVGAENKPQIVKHHLLQLEKLGLLQVSLDKKVIKSVEPGFNIATSAKRLFYSLPIVGTANCGPATIYADSRIEGYLKVSSKMLRWKKKGLYVLIADGPSMNNAEVRPGLTIDDGDFVIVDSEYTNPKNGDIVVAIIDRMATIKRYKEDKEHNRILLLAESTEKYLPVFVDPEDDFVISGKVIDVIKK